MKILKDWWNANSKKNRILISVIVSIFLIHIVYGIIDLISTTIYHHGLASVFKGDGFFGAFIVFAFTWFIMIYSFIILITGVAFNWPIVYIIFVLLAWASLFLLIKYTKGMKLLLRIIYIYLIPALIMSLGYLWHLPLH
ncbi:hypothetical protein KAR28_06830 [Candidatus Parcubacteria bacterium]|nr:hypothetical protein [Candidatus Parcubacteria bacterium]